MPVLPQLVMDVARVGLADAIGIGAWIGLAMAVATFFAAPVLGNLSDAFGRRTVLLLSLAGLAIDYVLLVFVARVISGIFGGSYGAAQAAIADVT
ncbi:MAG: MFS transporter, partial [Sphingopyxis sp.]|nr:MFS transporter [Sphingopyxis sp.]